MGMRGLLPKYLATFLERRRFSEKVKDAKSDVKIQENGIAQGYILSVAFFAIKIINIITNILSDNRLSASLYVDDFQIGYRHFDLAVIGSKLQVIDTLTECTFHNGFKFSLKKLL